MQQWEYLVLKTWGRKWQDSLGRTGETPKRKFTNDDSDFGPLLDTLGAEGWELTCNAAPGDSTNTRLVLKRPKRV